jgi:hypothetical protein
MGTWHVLTLAIALTFNGGIFAKSTANASASLEFSGIDLRQTAETNSLLSVSTKDSDHLVVLFLSAKCPCSMSHMDEIRSLAKDFPETKFLAINSNKDESREMGTAYFSKADLSFPVLRDEQLKYADLLKAVKTPHAFVLDKSGQIIFQGGVSDSAKFPNAKQRFLREALTEVKMKKSVSKPIARALGCAIARSE